MKRRHKQLLGIVVSVVVVAVIAYLAAPTVMKLRMPPETQPALAPPEAPPAGLAEEKPAAEVAAPAESAGAEAAQKAFQHGTELLAARKLIEARGELSAALFSGSLDDQQARQARNALEDLADITIFSSRIFEGDPYTFQYTVARGELLKDVERYKQLHVPPSIILKINGLRSAESIRAGQTLKFIQGPFHAVISNSRFTMDIYLQRSGLEKVYVKRLRVGLGKDGSTPTGAWKVALGRKMRNATWYPPPNSGVTLALQPGDKDYPLGKDGYWIGLEGTDPNTAGFRGYGIHGTNDPNSIGRAESLGCIRLADPDIDLVFSLLYEEWSTVRVEP